MTVVSRLVRIDVFSSLTDKELERVAAVVKHVRYPRGYHICRQGETCSSFYILDSGEAIARAVDEYGVEKPVAYLKAGRTLGQTSFLTGKPWEATAEVTADVELLRIDADDFELLLSEFPAMLERLGADLGLPLSPRARRFSWQEAGELTVWFGRRHTYFLLGKIASPVLSGIFLIIGFRLLYEPLRDYPVLVAFPVFGVLIVLWAAWEWIHWANDHFIVTNRRVIHTEWGLLHGREREEASLEKIQNINIVRSGALAKTLGFGNLVIATASASGGIVFDRIPGPDKVHETIFQQIERSQAWSRTAQQDEIREDLAHRLGLGHVRPTGSPTIPKQTPTTSPEGREGSSRRARRWRSPLAVRIEEGGNVIWRKHWIALIRELSKPLFGMIVLAILRFAPITEMEIPYIGVIPADPYAVALYILFGVVLALMFYQYVDWKNDLYMVTPDRIVDMERSPFRLREARREASLANIQNVRASRPNLLASLFNYGTVVIETAGQTGSFEFFDVADPPGVQRDIFEYAERYREQQRELASRRRGEEMGDWIDAYHSLR